MRRAGPDRGKKVHQRIGTGVTVAPVHEWFDPFENPISVVPLPLKEIDTLAKRRGAQDDALSQEDRIEPRGKGIEVPEIAPHQSLAVDLGPERLYDQRVVPSPREDAAIVHAACTNHAAIGAQRNGRRHLVLCARGFGGVRITRQQPVNHLLCGPIRPRR